MLHALLCLSPVVVLAVALIARRYPGERVLLTLRGAGGTRRLRPRARVLPARGRVVVPAVRGGRLIGCCLAVRPPPAPISAS